MKRCRDGRPKRIVVDIDGDGSFVMNCQELATVSVEKLETKIMILNNQHLGMVVQWEDRFYKVGRAAPWPCPALNPALPLPLPLPLPCPYPCPAERGPESTSPAWLQANRAHTYLGTRENEWHETKNVEDIFPDFVKMAESFRVPARRVIRPEDLRPAIREMLDTPGPFLLDVMVPHIEHVLPMIPGGGSFKDIITKGDGSDKY